MDGKPLSLSELQTLVNTSSEVVIEFCAGIEDQETVLMRGMRARVKSIAESEFGDHLYRVSVDLSAWEHFNQGFESHDYYDAAGVPCLTAREAGDYPKDHIENFYCTSETLGELVRLVDPSRLALVRAHLDSGSSKSYVAWLEDFALAQRSAPATQEPVPSAG